VVEALEISDSLESLVELDAYHEAPPIGAAVADLAEYHGIVEFDLNRIAGRHPIRHRDSHAVTREAHGLPLHLITIVPKSGDAHCVVRDDTWFAPPLHEGLSAVKQVSRPVFSSWRRISSLGWWGSKVARLRDIDQ
jgi:hypothetical protein